MHRLLTLLFFGLLTFTVAGCSWFSGDAEEEEKLPAPLTRFEAEATIEKAWDVRIGKGSGDTYKLLVPAIVDDRIFAASSDGNVAALDRATGKEIWAVRLKEMFRDESKAGFFSASDEHLISGGVGADEDFVVVAAVTGELIALNQRDGTFAWRARTSSEVVVPPVLTEDLVIAQSIDGSLSAYDAIDGTRRWHYNSSVPILTLRGTSTPVLVDNFVVGGFANGRVAFIDIRQGVPRWEQRIAVAKGQSELERLVDVDGKMVVSGDVLYAVSYQGNIVAIDLADGEIKWGKEASSFTGLGEGFGNIYIAHADGRLSAIDGLNSRDVWQLDAFTYRELTTPVTVGNHVAVGDFEGYVHLVAQSDGRLTGRRRVDRSGLRSGFLSDGNMLYIQGSSGRLTALRVE